MLPAQQMILFARVVDAGSFAAAAKVLGQTGINIMTRLMGLILAALAVELLSDGLIKLFPVLATNLR